MSERGRERGRGGAQEKGVELLVQKRPRSSCVRDTPSTRIVSARDNDANWEIQNRPIWLKARQRGGVGGLSPFTRTKGPELCAVFKFHDLCGVCSGNYIAGSRDSERSGSFFYARNKRREEKAAVSGGEIKKAAAKGGCRAAGAGEGGRRLSSARVRRFHGERRRIPGQINR